MAIGRIASAVDQHAATHPRRAASPRRPAPAVDLLRLQASAGNHVVTRLVAAGRTIRRQNPPPPAGGAAPARTPQQLADLTEDITQAIAEKETHRQAVESAMRTSAGVRASYASQVQATAGWTISALLALDDARLATFGLTRRELRDADARAAAAAAVWGAVMATPATTTAAAFATANAVQIAAAGLVQADIDRMFLFRDLKNDLEQRLTTDVPTRTAALQAMAPADVWALATPAERQRVGAAKVTQMTAARRNRLAQVIARREAVAAVAAGAPATTLGIPVGTINAYRPPSGGANWGEDRAAWQRVAAGREPAGGTGTVGARLQTAATADGGLRLARARIARINEQFLQANPTATDDQVCDNAATRHNPGNPMRDTVRTYFHGFQQQRAAPPAAPAPVPAAPAAGPTGSFDVGEGETRVAQAEPRAAEGAPPPELSEDQVLALSGLDDPEAGVAVSAPSTLAAKRDPAAVRTRSRVARQNPPTPQPQQQQPTPAPAGPSPPRPATTVAPPTGGTPPQSATREVTAAEAPASAQTAAPQTGGNTDQWFDDVVTNNLGVTPPAGQDPYDWLLTTLVTVRVFGVTSGPVLPRFATKLQRASARAEEMIRERFSAQGQPLTGPLTTAQWNVRSVSGWDSGRQRGSHAFGQATDIDYWSNPYVAHEAGAAEQAVDRETAPAYDRAVILFGDGTRLLSVIPNEAIGRRGDRIDRPERITNVQRPGGRGAAGRTALFTQTMTIYNQLASDSAAMQQYFALVYPPPDLTSMTPSAATPHAIDPSAAHALLPRLQALPPLLLQRVFDGAPPTTLDDASVAAALRPIIERDYERLGGLATNAGTAGDRPFATRADARQRAQRDPRRGFLTLPFEVVYAMRAEGLRWGACDLGGASGDIQHFDDAIAHPIPQRT